MTREQFAAKISWPKIIWLFGMINIVAMLPQLYKLATTHQTQGISPGTLWIWISVQIAFSLQGYFVRDKMLMWCLGLSAAVTASNIVLYYCFS